MKVKATYIIDFYDQNNQPWLGSDGHLITRLRSRDAIRKAVIEKAERIKTENRSVKYALVYHYEFRHNVNFQPKDRINL
jgi:hypothetical protein